LTVESQKQASGQDDLRASNTDTSGPRGDRKGGGKPPHSMHVFS